MSDPVITAIIGGIVTLVVAMLGRQNKKQHNKGYSLLEHVANEVKGHTHTLTDISEKVGGMEQWQVDHEARHNREGHSP